ncbi:MAG: hypothetical protein ACREMY_22240, partial [bacterium]
MMRLSSYLNDVHSQNGEDGALATLFDVVGTDRRYFVEFGAWDGRYLSNTFALIEKGWSGCLIEGDPKRFQVLSSRVRNPNISTVCKFVALEGPDSLDSILDDVGAPPEFDLLSIDVDSDDLAIWRSVRRHRPKCVVIEYNPTIPFDCRFENSPGKNWGNSALSIVDFGNTANYALVCVTATNLIFSDRASIDVSDVEEVGLADSPRGPRYFWGYDGTLLRVAGGERVPEDYAPELYGVPWTNCVATQPIPKVFRGYLDRGSPSSLMRRSLSLLIAGVVRPISS